MGSRKRWIYSAVSILLIAALLLPLGSFLRPTALAQGPEGQGGKKLVRAIRTPPAHLKEVPAELQARFKDGMSIQEFLALTGGRVPRALKDAIPDYPVNVIVEMEGAPLAVRVAELQKRGPAALAAFSQPAYVAQLAQAQQAIVPQIEALGAKVISHYTKAYNGMLVLAPLGSLDALRKLPGVKAVHMAPLHKPSLMFSVPLIRADQVWNTLGARGDGVTIAVIDTGVDYTHAALGGSGDPNDYANNDPTVIEPGTFPTAKVIGGYDFAGVNYNASDPNNAVPNPDPDPLDVHGHGTHVASTAAGIGVTGVFSEGVAPNALIYALKVFGDQAGSTALTVDAIEWAMDPNGDGDISDHVDVINMSLGADYGLPNDPSAVASSNAAALGIVVVAAAGNAGTANYITGSPASADGAISVAASTTGWLLAPTLSVSGTTAITVTNVPYRPPAFDNNTGHFTATVTAPLIDVSTFTTSTLCVTTGITGTPLAGAVALIERGDCYFSTKVNNAAALGAVAALIYNHSTGGNTFISMAGSPVSIPAGFLRRADGLNLAAWVAANPGAVVVIDPEDQVKTIPDLYTPADTLADFTSQGPRGTDSKLKPDVTAPGVGITAAAVGTGNKGVAFSGTSMATPHVAGVSALVRQVHPTWTPEEVKAALMNTAVDTADPSSAPYPLNLQGAGRVDAFDAAQTQVVAIGDPDRVSLSWGLLELNGPYMGYKTITLRNYGTTPATYNISWGFHYMATPGVTLTVPASVTVPAGGSAVVPVQLTVDPAAVGWSFFGEWLTADPKEFQGFVTFTPDPYTGGPELRVPFHGVLRPYAQLTDLGSVTTFDANTGYALFDLAHGGPISSSLWVYPALSVDPNETGIDDAADVRLFGMDYGWVSSTYSDVFIVAINTWGPWHTPQPYFAEFDLYFDVDGDGNTDFIDFNWNLGVLSGGDTDDWAVFQFDLATFKLYLASPYSIYTTFNSGFMEWYLPALWNGLDSTAVSGGDTDFDYMLVAWDVDGNYDVAGSGTFDYARPPFWWGWVSGFPRHPGPLFPETLYAAGINDLGGYLISRPKGAMIVDYHGRPGFGQAYYWPLNVTGIPTLYFPFIGR